MAMSRKHYRETAEAISSEVNGREDASEDLRAGVERIAERLALMFKRDNSSFRFDTFYAACGLDEWGKWPK